MAAIHRLRFPLFLRVFVLGLLVAGLVTKPATTLACEISEASAQVDKGPVSGIGGSTAGDGCCLLQECGDCCAHAPAMASQSKLTAGLPATTGPLPVLSMDFEPIAYPVAFRPPITI
jgi:hypothetical protein